MLHSCNLQLLILVNPEKLFLQYSVLSIPPLVSAAKGSSRLESSFILGEFVVVVDVVCLGEVNYTLIQ
jgi:hypothetical protein